MGLRLTQNERERLQHLVIDVHDARLLKRVRALLDLGAGDSPTRVSKRYNVARSTVYNWIKRCRTRGLSDQALHDLPRPGRPRKRRGADDGPSQAST